MVRQRLSCRQAFNSSSGAGVFCRKPPGHAATASASSDAADAVAKADATIYQNNRPLFIYNLLLDVQRLLAQIMTTSIFVVIYYVKPQSCVFMKQVCTHGLVSFGSSTYITSTSGSIPRGHGPPFIAVNWYHFRTFSSSTGRVYFHSYISGTSGQISSVSLQLIFYEQPFQ